MTAPKFDPSKWTANPRWWDLTIWGGGHTRETDPTQNGWRAALSAKGSPTLLVGRRGVVGCFSVQVRSPRWGETESRLDVALYTDETPEQVRDAMADPKSEASASVYANCEYIELQLISGWGLEAMRTLARRQTELEKYK